jgi:L,D-peptidoglycan transpeptidase YkuD (ErfK/YbiS/YcfS/YnhG family)
MGDISVQSDGTITFKDKKYRGVVGKNGVTAEKVEGDNKTPLGCFPIRRVFYRADKLDRPNTIFPTQAIKENDGWSDDATREEYNQLVTLPYDGSHENFWRSDDLYDIIVELGYNDDPPVPGKGSAIFVHVAGKGYTPTAGCVALSKSDLLEILSQVSIESKVCVTE